MQESAHHRYSGSSTYEPSFDNSPTIDNSWGAAQEQALSDEENQINQQNNDMAAMNASNAAAEQMNDAADAIRAGKTVILPTDTVYGLVASARSAAPVEKLYEVKGRDLWQPSALLAADLETLLEWLPELTGRAGVIANALLPGPYTLRVSPGAASLTGVQ